MRMPKLRRSCAEAAPCHDSSVIAGRVQKVQLGADQRAVPWEVHVHYMDRCHSELQVNGMYKVLYFGDSRVTSGLSF